MRRTVIGLSLAVTTLGGCAVLSDVISFLSQLDVLGVIPADGFADPASPDHGKVVIALGGRDDLGLPVAPAADEIEVVTDDGSDVTITDSREVEGHDQGSFLLLVDGSGSVEADPLCDGCPTDPGRLRVEAVKRLADDLEGCSGDWRMSLLEFGSDRPSAGMSVTTVVADWTTDAEGIATAADGLSSWYGTPLWDAVHESLDALAADADAHSGEDGASGRAIVVVSDGADTESTRTLSDVVGHATALGIAVHVLAFGPASDAVDSPDDRAVGDLRELAAATGGTYGYVHTVDDLPSLGEAIAGAVCGGYTEIVATFEEPAASGETVGGLVRLKSATDLGVPFTFRAP